MEKEFILYKQALALKELGFNEPCFGWSIPDNEKFIVSPCEKYNGREDLMTQIPLYQQAFRWFREKYSLSGNVDCCDNLCEWNIKSSKLDKSIFSNKIQSYEEAELECLTKLIEICKK